MEDIEDLDAESRLGDPSYDAAVVPRYHKWNKKGSGASAEDGGGNPSHGDLPGAQTVFVQSFGCSHNNSDGEYMAGQLAAYGYRVTSDFPNADIYLINSCTVKDPSERHFLTLMQKAQQTKKPTVVAGCVPSADPKKQKEWQGVSVIGVNDIDKVVEVVSEAAKGNIVNTLKPGSSAITKKKAGALADIHLPKIRRNEFIEIVPINRGCLNKCTYCKTKHARGDLKSWPPRDIIQRIEHVIQKEGVKEVRLTSEDTGAYGRDIGTDIATLLLSIVEVIPDGCMLRIGMTNPPYVMDHMADIAAALRHPNVYSFLHIPVQSGSDSVLALMRREYTRDEFIRLAKYLTDNVPHVTIATDVICGFPGETDENFEETLSLVRMFKFPSLFISQFYPRPGTPASAMKQLSSEIIKERSRKCTELFNSYTTNDYLVGTTQRVWITEMATDTVHFVGHTKSYVQVLLDPVECHRFGVGLGGSCMVKITSAEKFFTRANIVGSRRDSQEVNALVGNNMLLRMLSWILLWIPGVVGAVVVASIVAQLYFLIN